MSRFWSRLFGRRVRAPEVREAIEKRTQDLKDLRESIAEVDRLKNGERNGIIRDYEAAERDLRRGTK